MNLRGLDQKIEIERSEAFALKQSLEQYQYQLVQRATAQPLSIEQALSIRPTSRLLNRLTKMVAGCWPKYGPKRFHLNRPRKWQLEFDELLLLNTLYFTGCLPDGGHGSAHRIDLWSVMGKINQKAQNLTSYFKV